MAGKKFLLELQRSELFPDRLKEDELVVRMNVQTSAENLLQANERGLQKNGQQIERTILHFKEWEETKETLQGLVIRFIGGGHSTDQYRRHTRMVSFEFRYGDKSVQENVKLDENSGGERQMFGFRWRLLKTSTTLDPHTAIIEIWK